MTAGRSTSALVVGALVALACGITVWRVDATDSVATARPQSSCPARYGGTAPWTPRQATTVDRASRLTPQTTPHSVQMCAYSGDSAARRMYGWRLSGRRRLTAGLEEMATTLSLQPRERTGFHRACLAVGGPQVNYLLRMSYADGRALWVSISDEASQCVYSTNGEFTSWGTTGLAATKAFQSGRWPAPGRYRCPSPAGRLGQETTMVPGEPESVRICSDMAPNRLFTHHLRPLVQALNHLHTFASDQSCEQAKRHPAGLRYVLVFMYPTGPRVRVGVDGACNPAVDNLSLQADDAGPVLSIIHTMLKS